MNGKRVLAAILSLLAVFTLVACKQKKKPSVKTESTTVVEDINNDVVTEAVANTEFSGENTNTDTSSQNAVPAPNQSQSVETTVAQTNAGETQNQADDDPASWSTEKIVEEYKNAARKSNSTVKSKQSIALKDISVNDGEYDNVMDFVGGIMGKFLESNSTEKNGITGGFENLAPQDISSAKAYKQGDDTVVELYLVEQTSGPKEDANSGSVGHAITAVGDIALVVDDLSERGLPLELSEDETKIYYTNPSVKVVINSNGEIVSGTWFYTVEISMHNFKAFGQNVNKASIIMDNTISV